MAQSAEAGNQRQIQMQRQMSTDEVLGETPDIVTFFIADRMEAQGLAVPEVMRQTSVNNEVATCLRQIGDDLENNHSLNSLIGQIEVSPQTAFDVFAKVAETIFSDGIYNWGRIVALFYFGFKLASSVLSQIPLLKLVVEWVVRFVRERLVKWVAEQGGWRAIREYVSGVSTASTSQVVGVAMAAVACVLLVWGKS